MAKNKKQEEALKAASLKRLHIKDFVHSEDARAPIDIYVRLPKNKRLVLWVEQGEEFPKDKLDRLGGHTDPYIYVVESSLFWGERPGRIRFEEMPHIDQDKLVDETLESSDAVAKNAAELSETETSQPKDVPGYKVSKESSASAAAASTVITLDDGGKSKKPAEASESSAVRHSSASAEESAEVQDFRRKVKHQLSSGGSVHVDNRAVESRLWGLFQPTLEKEMDTKLEHLIVIGEELLPLVSDEAVKFHKMIVQNPRYGQTMRDSLAIYGIATLFCLASGYTLRGILEELAFAVIFMDLPTVDIGEDIVGRYYADPNSLTEVEKKNFREHPTIAHKAAREKLKRASQNCLRMIEGHHEWANGEGFPRGIRNENLPPLVRILSFAVLVFEAMKRAELSGSDLEFHKAVEAASELDKPVASRRAHATTLQSIVDFLNSKAAKSAA